MKYVAAILLGILIGIILWEKIGVGDQYKAYIRKLKQRGRDNASQDVVFKPFTGLSGKSNGKIPLNERRAKNKEKRQARRAARKG